MATVADLITEFRETVRETDKDNSHFSDTEIIRWLDVGQVALCSGIDFLIKQVVRLSEEDQRQYSLPDGFKTCLRVSYDGRKLEGSVMEREDFYDGKWKELTGGRVDRYLIIGDFLYLIKKPQETGKDIYMIISAFPSRLKTPEDTPEIPERFQPSLVVFALSKGFKKIKQVDVAREYQGEFRDWRVMAEELATDKNRDLSFLLEDQTKTTTPVHLALGEWIRIS